MPSSAHAFGPPPARYLGTMGTRKKVVTVVGGALAPKVIELAPGVAWNFVRQALYRAIEGVGPLPPAETAADKQLHDHDGDAEGAIHEIVERHVAFATAGGFVTNLGGLATTAVLLPTNVTGLALVQCRMVAEIAHLRRYDLEDPRVRNAILMTLLGRERVDRQVRAKKLPAPPMAIATAPTYDATLDRIVAAEVAAELISRAAGKRLATTVARKVPIVGGVVGGSADAVATYQIGRYARRELLLRAVR